MKCQKQNLRCYIVWLDTSFLENFSESSGINLGNKFRVRYRVNNYYSNNVYRASAGVRAGWRGGSHESKLWERWALR